MSDKIYKTLAGDEDKPLKIGDVEMECYVLENGERVIHEMGLQRAFNLGESGGGKMKEYLGKKALKPFFDEGLLTAEKTTFKFFKPKSNNTVAKGYRATIVNEICKAILKYRREVKSITPKDEMMANQAEILLGGFAEVGITALVDEATGYKKKRKEYEEILQQYISEHVRPWVKTFDENYYHQLYRLLGWDFENFLNNKKNHPQVIGKMTNRIVYEKLPAGVLEKLQEINPKNLSGNRVSRFHQHLSENTGYTHLLKHLGFVTAVLKKVADAGGTMQHALTEIDREFPTENLPVDLFKHEMPLILPKVADKSGDKQEFSEIVIGK